jgi:hypothetical protein
MLMCEFNWMTFLRLYIGAFFGAAALFSSGASHAACPFNLPPNAIAAAPRDARELVLFSLRQPGVALLSSERTTHAHVAANLARLDINADGAFDATDAVIITRALLGFRDGALTDGLPTLGARSGAAIQAFVDAGCAADAASAATWQSASMSESSARLTNPERGFWVFLSDNFVNIDDATISYFQTTYPDVTLGYGLVRLDAFRDEDSLPQSLIDGINAAFAKVRARGMKLVLRFAYNNGGAPTDADAPLARVRLHIAQLAPVVQANVDVVYVWQAGFIGQYGEAHDSTNGLDTRQNKAVIRDELLAVLPANRFLMWRDPKDQIEWDADAGSEADAFASTRKAKIGMYNDCFLSSDTDVGTYSDNAAVRTAQRSYVATRTSIVPYGGETCNADVVSQQRRSCAAIRAEGAQFHVSYLNRTYFDGFLNQWASEGCFDEIANKLGYRWVLTDARAPKQAVRGNPLQVAVGIKNVGWARLYNPRSITVQLVSRSNPAAPVILAPAAWDPRSLKPGEEASALFTVNVPSNAFLGEYDVWIAAPDASSSIAANPAYAIRFANSDDAIRGQSWSATRGAFATGLRIRID